MGIDFIYLAFLAPVNCDGGRGKKALFFAKAIMKCLQL